MITVTVSIKEVEDDFPSGILFNDNNLLRLFNNDILIIALIEPQKPKITPPPPFLGNIHSLY